MAAFSEAEAPSPDIYIPEEWSEAAETIAYDSVTSPPPVALVCGAKNCGKTTFSRHLLNILLQRYQKVAYLDTDVGQTEFTPPGFLSLTVIDQLTPDLTIPCLKTPERLNGRSVMTDEEWDKMDFKVFWSGEKGITWFNEPFWMRGSCELMNHSS